VSGTDGSNPSSSSAESAANSRRRPDNAPSAQTPSAVSMETQLPLIRRSRSGTANQGRGPHRKFMLIQVRRTPQNVANIRAVRRSNSSGSRRLPGSMTSVSTLASALVFVGLLVCLVAIASLSISVPRLSQCLHHHKPGAWGQAGRQPSRRPSAPTAMLALAAKSSGI
jgi:hypothetical protein